MDVMMGQAQLQQAQLQHQHQHHQQQQEQQQQQQQQQQEQVPPPPPPPQQQQQQQEQKQAPQQQAPPPPPPPPPQQQQQEQAQAPQHQVPYAEASYWAARYTRDHPFEWFLGYTALRRVLRAHLPKRGRPVLQIGCGTSAVQEGMARAGWAVVNVDIAPNVIERMAAQHADLPRLSYAVADCRDMPQFTDCSFGGVLDKGTIDALLCCKAGVANAAAMFSEVSRVLAPGGAFLLVSLGDPARRLCLLCCERYDWTVQVLLLPKIAPGSQATLDGRPINDSLAPIDALGPFDAPDAQTVAGLPPGLDVSDYFFAYVCRKRRLQLPLHRGDTSAGRARLPQGWLLASRSIAAKIQQDLDLPADVLSRGVRTRTAPRPPARPGGAAAARGAAVAAPPGGGGGGAPEAPPPQAAAQPLPRVQSVLDFAAAGGGAAAATPSCPAAPPALPAGGGGGGGPGAAAAGAPPSEAAASSAGSEGGGGLSRTSSQAAPSLASEAAAEAADGAAPPLPEGGEAASAPRARRHSAPAADAAAAGAAAAAGLFGPEPCVPPDPPRQGSLRLALCDGPPGAAAAGATAPAAPGARAPPPPLPCSPPSAATPRAPAAGGAGAVMLGDPQAAPLQQRRQ
ncbi:MAG: hypothetical protein J3K34DRAFT_523470 [Monoraphidium minutum]|nr:MAG: hypothetical protein J3K34DRAFT_523470 [Monoraphidium minutum]